MTQSQMRRLEALRRMQGFMDANASLLPTVSGAPARALLDTAVIAMLQYAVAQSQAQTELTSRTKVKATLREDLRMNHMQPIAAIAKKEPATLGAMQDLKLPGKGTKDALLVSRGYAMAAAVATVSQTFIDQHLPADFIAQLQASVKAVDDLVQARNAALNALRSATQGVKFQFGITHTEVGVLSALVVKALKGRTDLITAWRTAKRVTAKPGVVDGTGTATPVVPAPAPAPVTSTAPAEVPVVKAA